jgi:glycogen debranching enzyme
LTPVGLRSLDPEHEEYSPRYEGNSSSRDGAYHQGTVWSWLLGPFVTALARVEGEPGKRRGGEILERLSPHLSEAGIGSVSEIFDGDAPHTPRGCVTQAWSVAEILRAYLEDTV